MSEFSDFQKFINSRNQIFVNEKPNDPDVVAFNQDVLVEEYNKGIPEAESTAISEMDVRFKWKRGFQNVFTGYPNDGKTQFILFLMTIKSLADEWKWIVWSPEMMSANFLNGKVAVNYSDIYNDISWALTGKTPYKHIAHRDNMPRQTQEEFVTACEWIAKHFLFLNPIKKKPDYIEEVLQRQFDKHGCDGVLIDPFKNMRQDSNMRDDLYLDQLFDKYKHFAVKNNVVHNWIAHPKSNVVRIKNVNGHETLMPCDQYMLLGGAAWDNGMDGIYSVFRYNTLNDKNDPNMYFYNLKQRKQAITAYRGVVTDIKFNINTYRYYFLNGMSDPMSRLAKAKVIF